MRIDKTIESKLDRKSKHKIFMPSKRRKFSLKNLSIQLSLIAIGIPTLVLALFGIYQIQTQTVSLEKKLKVFLINEAVQLSASLSTALFNFDDETCKVICKAALKKPEIIKITIWDLGQEYLSFQDELYQPADREKGTKITEFPISFQRETSPQLFF
ncbi:MAG: hypothetical protein K8S13_24320 [Desulfobacula sp.]|uniref:hypothetical protein n=1 Tax=Desulfobacula sp. TaxID=2593537 RepID=UPI0025C42EFE|nr:hypothetical protein [Desulfobacula sp.]MCD4722955.1 hypothetical protein [Desulfobacula sp.]